MFAPRTIRLLAALALGLAATTAPADPGTNFYADATASAAALEQWYNPKGLWTTTGWWNAANCLEAVEGVIVADNGARYLDVLPATFDRNRAKNFLNQYYDDEGWWALAWIRAFDLTGDPRYLAAAKTIFADLTTGWDDHCGGGLWWRKDRHYKNAIPNELFLLVAARLGERTPGDAGPGSYHDWALREWAWFRHSGMINSQNLVNDGLDDNCENNHRRTWTYNQGVLIGGLTELYTSTGDTNYLGEAETIAAAAMASLVDDHGILREPKEPPVIRGEDVPQFKGIFIHHLATLYDVTGNPAYRDFIVRNALAVWRNDRTPENYFGGHWSGPVDVTDAARQSSALQLFVALAGVVTTNPAPAWAVDHPVHAVGRPDGQHNWTANPWQDPASGDLARGSVTGDLPAGNYAAEFELKVDNFNRDAGPVTVLTVSDTATRQVLAQRSVRRDEFPNVLYHTCALPFPAQTGRRYELRVGWIYSPRAPRLSERSLSLRRLD